MFKNNFPFSIRVFVIAMLLFCCLSSLIHDTRLIPVTSGQKQYISSQDNSADVRYSSHSLINTSGIAVKLLIENIRAFPVVQQPINHPEYVSSDHYQLTQFSSAQYFGSLGFLAHNTLAGEYFDQITPGNLIFVTLDNYEVLIYKVKEIRSFQANTPSSPFSTFTDLASKITYSAEDLFYMTYGVSGRLILQTCIEKDGIENWGRLFVISEPVDYSYTAYRFDAIRIPN